MRESIEDQSPEPMQKLPPKQAAELIILIARETNRRVTVRAPRPAMVEGTGGSGLVTTHGEYRRVATN